MLGEKLGDLREKPFKLDNFRIGNSCPCLFDVTEINEQIGFLRKCQNNAGR